MKVNISNRLSFRLARNTVILAVVLGLALSLIQVIIDYVKERNQLDAQISAIVTVSHAPASQIAYNIDSRLAEELLDGLLQHPSIIHAEIIDSDNRILASRERSPSGSTYRWLSDALFQPTRTYTEALFVRQSTAFELGDLNVVVDTYPTGKAFLERAAFTLLSGFVRSLILSAVLLILFYVMLTQPLLNVISSVSEVDPQTPEKVRLPVPKGHEYDEIGVLVHATNNQLQAIDANLAKLRKAESRLKTYSEQLEQIVDSRTKELSEKNKQLVKSNYDLRLAKEEAVRRAKSRADFLASMSHEIRTPFNGVLGMISLTLEEPLSERQIEQLNVAYNSGIALLDLLNDILDISKVEAGKLTLESISFDLRKTVEDTARLLAQNAHAKGIALHTAIDPSFPEAVFGDPTRIRQIVSNLAGNAIKFTEKGYVKILLKYADPNEVVLSVVDTGIGISEDQYDRIFSPFAQGASETTRRYGGTGLGLTLCRQLAQQMGGSIQVDSTEGEGSEFTVHLPLERDTAAAEFELQTGLRQYKYHLIHHVENLTFDSIIQEFENWGLKYHQHTYTNVENNVIKDLAFDDNTVLLYDSRILAPLLTEHPDSGLIKVILVTRQTITANEETLSSMRIDHLLTTPVSRGRLYETLLKATTSQQDSAPDQRPEDSQAVKGKRVLLVEDNQVNQMVAKSILTKMGFQVAIAKNGKDAVEQLPTLQTDIILMDCHMPIMDGYEATRLIRQNSTYDAIPIIAVTANVMHGDRERCISCGMNDYLTKPYEKKALEQMLTKWLKIRAKKLSATGSERRELPQLL